MRSRLLAATLLRWRECRSPRDLRELAAVRFTDGNPIPCRGESSATLRLSALAAVSGVYQIVRNTGHVYGNGRDSTGSLIEVTRWNRYSPFRRFSAGSKTLPAFHEFDLTDIIRGRLDGVSMSKADQPFRSWTRESSHEDIHVARESL